MVNIVRVCINGLLLVVMAPPTIDTLRAALDRLRRELAEDPLDIGAMVAFAHVSAALAVLKGAEASGGR